MKGWNGLRRASNLTQLQEEYQSFHTTYLDVDWRICDYLESEI